MRGGSQSGFRSNNFGRRGGSDGDGREGLVGGAGTDLEGGGGRRASGAAARSSQSLQLHKLEHITTRFVGLLALALMSLSSSVMPSPSSIPSAASNVSKCLKGNAYHG
ncbi:hypothetical protein BDA96_05G022500 [Sorghum bicolor]|uniref:Uncharacterized protein n=1 Tax=Sorghum bicolor TaxID=4558 RepID=A0A921QUC3_SORBI|nr:hypothetical protein BDA96_05G022500 [Sorghum bicolor]KAG0528563.1 hypothetical protein BDA96_05G022500 [Sorghum bicolor]